MGLSDIMGQLKLHFWAEIGLVFFLGIFLAVVLYTFLRRNRATFDRARHLPLEDGERAGTAETTHGD